MRKLVFALAYLCFLTTTDVALSQSAGVQLEHYNTIPSSPGTCSSGWCHDGFQVCNSTPKKFRANFQYFGGHISGTCNANNPNNFRFKINVYRNGIPIVPESQANGKFGYYPSPGLDNISASPGTYHATGRLEKKKCVGGAWVHVNTWTSNTISVGNIAAVPNFKINGVVASATTVPTVTLQNGEPILLDGSATTCASAYNIWVSETGTSHWERTYNYEWDRWFTGAPPSSINLQNLATDSLNYGSFSGPPNRKGQILFGGVIAGISIPPGSNVLEPYQSGLLGQTRRYTVQMATNPPWTTKRLQLIIQ